jgi:hypothetical protein
LGGGALVIAIAVYYQYFAKPATTSSARDMEGAQDAPVPAPVVAPAATLGYKPPTLVKCQGDSDHQRAGGGVTCQFRSSTRSGVLVCGSWDPGRFAGVLMYGVGTGCPLPCFSTLLISRHGASAKFMSIR